MNGGHIRKQNVVYKFRYGYGLSNKQKNQETRTRKTKMMVAIFLPPLFVTTRGENRNIALVKNPNHGGHIVTVVEKAFLLVLV